MRQRLVSERHIEGKRMFWKNTQREASLCGLLARKQNVKSVTAEEIRVVVAISTSVACSDGPELAKAWWAKGKDDKEK